MTCNYYYKIIVVISHIKIEKVNTIDNVPSEYDVGEMSSLVHFWKYIVALFIRGQINIYFFVKIHIFFPEQFTF